MRAELDQPPSLCWGGRASERVEGSVRKLGPVLAFTCGALLLSGCEYALNKTNPPSIERIKVVAPAGSQYAIRIENHEETAVPQDGKVDLAVPSLGRGCSVYLFGLIQVREGNPEYFRAIHVVRDGKVVRNLSLHSLHKIEPDTEGYRRVKL